MTSQQLHAELLLGEKVFAMNGVAIGRLEEIRTEINKGHCFVSEFLVGTIEHVRSAFGVTEIFVGVIIVAVIGNAAEHSTAVLMALKNKMDLSVGIAIGSSLQIALFVAPVLVFLSYLLGRPMDLEFTRPEVFAIVASVYILFQISGDGETNWIEGVQLLSLYIILGILFFYLPEAIVH